MKVALSIVVLVALPAFAQDAFPPGATLYAPLPEAGVQPFAPPMLIAPPAQPRMTSPKLKATPLLQVVQRPVSAPAPPAPAVAPAVAPVKRGPICTPEQDALALCSVSTNDPFDGR